MEYLLDTHVILLWLTTPEKIKAKAKNIVTVHCHPTHARDDNSVNDYKIIIKDKSNNIFLIK